MIPRMSTRTRNAVKAALWTALFTFLSVFAMTALGWLGQVGEWAGSNGASPFPGVSVLGFGVVSAAVAAATGFVNFVIRYAQAKGVLPGSGPSYTAEADIRLLLGRPPGTK